MADRQDFLFELGTEELPPNELRSLRDALIDDVRRSCDDNGLKYGDFSGYVTPRRLAVRVSALASRQPEQSVERRGPSVEAAFDNDGNPTRAAEGFARSCGVSVEELERIGNRRGAWLYYRATQPGEPTAALLPKIVTAAIAALPISKRMRWGNSDESFIRPVHWMVALFGHDIVPLALFGVNAGRTTYGHRFHYPDAIVLPHAEAYVPTLTDPGHVVADLDKRIEIIREQVEQQGGEVGGRALIEDELLQEVAGLVEWPVALAGHFEARFLDLPREVLIATLQGHQRYFPVVGSADQLLPAFITVSNIRSLQPEQVRQGNERVVRPRLSDALFFWQQDRKQPLAQFNHGLQHLAFQQALGSMADKVERIRQLAAAGAGAMGADPALVDRAAQLCKADLLTAMVYEFTELQGVMGKYYARASGEPDEVAQALQEQYQPRFAKDVLPATPSGQAIAIADRLDTLAGIFAIDKRPSGDKDPFGLRRAALGVIRILIECKCDLNLRNLVQQAVALQPVAVNGAALVTDIMAFILERMRAYYVGTDVTSDMFNAVAAVGNDRPLDFDHRLKAVQHFVSLPEAAHLAAAHKRIRNLLKQVDSTPNAPVEPNRLIEDAEKSLHAATLAMNTRIGSQLKAHNYDQALQSLASLQQPVDTFFDDVMVMSEDYNTRINRLALLGALDHLCRSVADISYLPE